MKFSFIAAEKALTPPIATVSELCRTLNVSRSGFYAWCSRPRSAHSIDDEQLRVKIGETFERGRRKYGSP